MCLQLYSKVTQYMPQVLTPPSKAHTDRLFAAFDLDDSGRLERAEWQLLASVPPLTLTLALALALALALTLALNPNQASIGACNIARPGMWDSAEDKVRLRA